MKRYLEILKLVWPLALGMINNAVMQFVDRAFLAKESLGSIEAVLPACTLAWVFMGFFQSIVGYSGVFVSQYHGSGEEGKCRDSYRAGLFIAAIAGVISLLLIPLGDWIFVMTAPTSEVAWKESVYFNIVILGSVFLYGQMASIAYYTGHGRTRILFWVNLIGNLLNIALDPLLIFGLKLGIAGAAIATVISQFAQFLTLLLMDKTAAGLEPPYPSDPFAIMLKFRFFLMQIREVFFKIIRFGIPAGGYEVLNMLSFTIFVFVTGTVGELDFAASNACFTVNYLLFAPMMGFAIGAQTLVGQAIGRKDEAAAVSDFRKTLLLGICFAFVAGFVVLLINRPILSMFVPDGVDAAKFYSLGFKLLMIMAVWLLFDALDVIVSGALRGAGDTKFVFLWMLLSAFGLWMPLVCMVKIYASTIVDLWLTMIVYVLMISIGSYIRWHRGYWKRIEIK